jgi:hypothetical protein
MLLTRKPSLSRRTFLQYTTAFATAVVATESIQNAPVFAATSSNMGDRTEPEPLNPIHTILELTEKYPLIAIGEAHQLQEQHDFFDTLLHHQALPGKINDIVVEFGNALYQDIADNFVAGKAVANKDLQQIWRNTVITGGNPVWDAPVYEQFFRIVREINRSLSPEKQMRVLLGDSPINWSTVQTLDDYAQFALQRDAHYVSVVEQEVLQKKHRALLIAGNGHFLRGLRIDGDPRQPSNTWPFDVGTILSQNYPGKLFIINPLLLEPQEQDQQSQLVANWHTPALALLANTWLAAEPIPASDRNSATTLGAQCDAVLYFGGVGTLTASRAEPALYQGGDYATELLRRGNLLAEWGVQQGNPLDSALHTALLGPSYYSY